ncbi:hypothetical protein QYM13_27030 [Bacillus pacificus]|uniref:hypothetical protein n=1 Tax=Bacillus TaxID=1386 RepID=UPI000B67DBE0|nr:MULTISPECIES: hypothetical protein [Bacillus]MDQ7237374.1 hypothetical protein [Bacillus pacificus]MDQ7240426.1 hypothetical protein [Bacillus pacificus]MED1299763.1 hypothetical protein [Bacillus pacificus]OUB15440.1 hypothetical protein BK704_06450 [[Bacillus thuringiensis] serovar konkukian]
MKVVVAPFHRDTKQETVDRHTSEGEVLDVTVKEISELEYKRENTNMNKYIKVAVAYKFKPEGEVYKQAQYRKVTPEEDIQQVQNDVLHIFSNLFDKLVYLEGINVTEVSEIEYRAGRIEEDAELRFLQQITLDGCVS